jgi:hypothetical protein
VSEDHARKRYIFRWKDGCIEVRPSIADTREEVWAWATRNLRGATETTQQGARNVRRYGEVVEVKP